MNKKYYHIIIAVLVLLNIFSWRMWWEKPVKDVVKENVRVNQNNNRKQKGMDFFAEKLSLTTEQQNRFEELRKEYFSNVDSLKHSMFIVRKGLIDNSKSYNSEVADSLLKEMGNLKLQMELSTMKHFQNLREECNQNQVEMFDSLMMGMMDRRGRYGRKGGRHTQ